MSISNSDWRNNTLTSLPHPLIEALLIKDLLLARASITKWLIEAFPIELVADNSIGGC